MALRADHSDLPADDGGWTPDRDPRFLAIVAQAWADRTRASWAKPIAGGTKMRLSKVGACARETSYFIQGLEESNPPSLASLWRMGLGTFVHDEVVLPALEEAFGETAEIERLVTFADRDDDLAADISGRIDLFVVTEGDEPHRTVVELKTINGMGLKMAVGGGRGGAEGPKLAHVHQAALAALALDADDVVLLYLGFENISAALARNLGFDVLSQMGAQWTIHREQWEPIARAEVKRQQRIAELVAAGTLAPRSMPDIPAKARITDPATGAWTIEINGEIVQAGKVWRCADYCGQRDRCIADGAS